jgi:diguanylate cyclase (GGDEF)-like protein/PAS domain S-box-containing protein
LNQQSLDELNALREEVQKLRAFRAECPLVSQETPGNSRAAEKICDETGGFSGLSGHLFQDVELTLQEKLGQCIKINDLLRILKEIADSLPIGITFSDINGRIIYTNPAELEIHGYQEGEVSGMEARMFAPEYLGNPLTSSDRPLHVWQRERLNIRKDGVEFPVQLTSIPVRDDLGNCLGLVTVCEDITGRKETEVKIHRLAYYDFLTGLPNRGLFLEQLQKALALAHRQERKLSLFFMDLDHFKDVNDTLGHDIGDKLLCAVAERLATQIRESDILARLGGDEFVLVPAAVDNQEKAAIAARRILSLFAKPFLIGARQIFANASIGIAMYPDNGMDTETLLKCADTAMYQTKNQGRSHFSFFSTELNRNVTRRVALENRLRKALEDREFFLNYQPIWDLKTGRMTGVESLVRWQSGDYGLLQPFEFIPLAENSGFILALEEWVLEKACLQSKNLESNGSSGLRMGVNISGKQFRQPDFLEKMRQILYKAGIGPELLELEITESVIMEKSEKTNATLQALKKMGIRLTIDNFGTGYSSLSCLKYFPIDRLKIHRSFISEIISNKNDAAIVRAIISMGHSMNIRVVAVGIENNEQLDYLAELGCDEAQGFYLTEPMDPDKLNTFLREKNAIVSAGLPVK